MITATEASRLTLEFNNYTEPLEDIEKYIRWATEKGKNFTTAHLNNHTANVLQENGFSIEAAGTATNLYFIKW